MDVNIGDIIGILTLCGTLIAAFAAVLTSGKHRHLVFAALEKYNPAELYVTGINRGLKGLNLFFGPAKSWKAFNRCLTLAYLYPLIFMCFSWVAGQSPSIAGLPIFPGDWTNGWLKGLLAVALMGYFVVIFWVDQREKTWGAKLKDHPRIFIRLLGWLFRLEAGAVILAGALAVALALALVLVLASAVAEAGAIVVGVVDAEAGAVSFLLLFIILPYANALLDWLSWSLSRYFVHTMVTTNSFSKRIRHFLADFVLAGVFMVGLCILVPFLLQLVNFGSVRLGIPTEDWLLRFDDSFHAPWTSGLMFTLMLVTTLIPTALHILLFVFAVLGWTMARAVNYVLGRDRELGGESIERSVDAGWESFILFCAAALTIALPVLLLIGLESVLHYGALLKYYLHLIAVWSYGLIPLPQ